MKLEDLNPVKLMKEIMANIQDGLDVKEAILHPDIRKILDEDPEGWKEHISLLEEGKPGLKKYKKYGLAK